MAKLELREITKTFGGTVALESPVGGQVGIAVGVTKLCHQLLGWIVLENVEDLLVGRAQLEPLDFALLDARPDHLIPDSLGGTGPLLQPC